MSKIKSIAFSACMLLLGCKPKPSKDAPEPKDTPKAAESNPEEKVDIPSNVTGSFLVCALREEASAENLEQEFGCRLQDPDSGKKIGVDQRLTWTSNLSEGVVVEVQDQASPYHVLYKVGGSTLDEVQGRASTLEALARFNDVIFKREKVYNILKPAIDLEDYEAPIDRKQTIQEDDDGSL